MEVDATKIPADTRLMLARSGMCGVESRICSLFWCFMFLDVEILVYPLFVNTSTRP